MPDVVVERRGAATWLRLNRPERRNAYDVDLLGELTAAIRSAEDHSNVIVLTGTGSAFCSGGYLGNLADPDPAEIRRMFHGSMMLFDAIRSSLRPVIAAVNGAAAGGGNELVVACDLAIAAGSATFGQTGVRVGSAPVLGGTNLLAISIGEKRAKEVAFLCKRYTAAEALNLGWINEVVADDQLIAATDAMVESLAQMSPRYLGIAKASSNIWWNACRDSYMSGLAMLDQAIGSEDMLEGAQAFLEKRSPRFRQPRVSR